MIQPPIQKTVGICKQIILLLLYYISSRLVILLKVTDAPIQVPNIFYLTIRLKILSFGSQLFFIFDPQMSASFTTYIVEIIFVALAWIL